MTIQSILKHSSQTHFPGGDSSSLPKVPETACEELKKKVHFSEYETEAIRKHTTAIQIESTLGEMESKSTPRIWLPNNPDAPNGPGIRYFYLKDLPPPEDLKIHAFHPMAINRFNQECEPLQNALNQLVTLDYSNVESYQKSWITVHLELRKLLVRNIEQPLPTDTWENVMFRFQIQPDFNKVITNPKLSMGYLRYFILFLEIASDTEKSAIKKDRVELLNQEHSLSASPQPKLDEYLEQSEKLLDEYDWMKHLPVNDSLKHHLDNYKPIQMLRQKRYELLEILQGQKGPQDFKDHLTKHQETFDRLAERVVALLSHNQYRTVSRLLLDRLNHQRWHVTT